MGTTPAKGRADYLELGDWNAACAECGRKRKASELRQLPPGVPGGGMWVCFPEHWTPRQPQDYVRGIPEKMNAPWVQQQVDYAPLEVENVGEDTANLEIEIDTASAEAGSEPIIINVFGGVTVGTLTITDGSGGIAAPSVVLNNSGVVEEIINADDVTITAQGNGLTAGVAFKLAFTTQPTDVAVDTNISPAVVVTIQDYFGNTVASAVDTITLALNTNPGGAVLSGILSQAAVAGIATFSNLQLNEAEEGYSLVATATGLASAVSSLFEVTGGYVLTAVQINGTDVGMTGYGGVGSIAPTSYGGSTIFVLFAEYNAPPFPFWNVYFYLATDALPQTFFTTLVLNGQTFLSADATYFAPGGGVTIWQWGDNTVNEVLPGAGTYAVEIS